MLVDPVEVEGPAIDEELGAGDVHGADADRECVHVLQQLPAHLGLHLHLQGQGGMGGILKGVPSALSPVCQGDFGPTSLPSPASVHACSSLLLLGGEPV